MTTITQGWWCPQCCRYHSPLVVTCPGPYVNELDYKRLFTDILEAMLRKSGAERHPLDKEQE